MKEVFSEGLLRGQVTGVWPAPVRLQRFSHRRFPMADVSAARTRAVFEFKSATLPLIAVILKTSDLDVLAEALDAQLADSPDFFEQEPVVIDLSLLQEAHAARAAKPSATSTSPPCAACWRATRPSRSRCAAAAPRRTPRPARPACR